MSCHEAGQYVDPAIFDDAIFEPEFRSHVIVLLDQCPDAPLCSNGRPGARMANPTELTSTSLDEALAVLTRGRGESRLRCRDCRPQVVGRCGAGLDSIGTAAARTSRVTVMHAPGRTTYAVSEHALMLMLASPVGW